MTTNKFFFIGLLFFQTFVSSAQFQVTIEAFLLDNSTGSPLEFVSVEFLNTSLRTTSNDQGKFTFQFEESSIGNEDEFRCTLLGYETITVKASQLFKSLKNSNKIYLKLSNQNNLKNKETIVGLVSSESQPIQGATVNVKNSFDEVVTDVDGKYSIQANEGDVIVVKFLGMITKEIQVLNQRSIDVKLQTDGELLDEVLLEGQRDTNEELIQTSFGKRRESSIGYSVNTIKSEDIGVAALSLADIIVGRFAGVRVAGLNVAYNSPKFIIRGGGGSITNPIPAIFVVDGMIYTEMPNFIDVQQIKTISILKSIIATNRYGTIGSGGAFVIEMKSQAALKPTSIVNDLLVKGNNYEENLEFFDFFEDTPSYIKHIETANTFIEAKKIYESQQDNVARLGIPYLLDVSNYFRRWNKSFANQVLMTISKIAYNNPKALKTLAYQLEVNGAVEKAKLVYQRIVALRPESAQSYRDLALIYQSTKNYNEAMTLYGDMLGNKIVGVDFSGLKNTITNELKHFLAKHRDKVDYSLVASEFLKADFKYDIRIVFDYSDANTEFELQFINPDKKFYVWPHTRIDNLKRMLDDLQKGVSTEEYIIDDAESGEWIINIECFTDEVTTNPSYLKYTVFKNYGLPNETKEIKVIQLYKYQQKVTLDRFMY